MDLIHAEHTAQSLAHYSSWGAAIAFPMFAQLANRVYTTATWIFSITGREMTDCRLGFSSQSWPIVYLYGMRVHLE